MNALIQLCELAIVLIKRLDLIDLPFVALALATQQPAFALAALLQAIGRRWPRICYGALSACRVGVVKEWHCKVLPGARRYVGEVISLPPEQREAPDEADIRAGISPPVSVSVSVSSTDTGRFDLAAIPSDLTYEETVAILEKQRAPSGKPTHSGKKIYTWVGGNYNEFTALMRQLRTKDDAPAEPPQTTTPIAHRQTRAAFRETEPELACHPPE